VRAFGQGPALALQCPSGSYPAENPSEQFERPHLNIFSLFSSTLSFRERSMAKATTLPKLPTLSTAQVALLLKVTPAWVRELSRAGHITKTGRDRFELVASVHGCLDYIRDEQRRSTKSASASRVQDARAREIQLRVAEREGRLVDLVEHQDLFVEVFGALKAGLAGVPAEVTADRAMRGKIEAAINHVLQHAAERFEAAAEETAAGAKSKGARR